MVGPEIVVARESGSQKSKANSYKKGKHTKKEDKAIDENHYKYDENFLPTRNHNLKVKESDTN